tara:strand:+ start:26243 stop:27094 length:852 start_codon:yes stop_codon:yes gene_type:complete
MADRVHSSDIQLFVNDQRIPAISSANISTNKSLVDIPRLGAAHIVDRVLTSNQSTTLSYDLIVSTGATGIDPTYSYQNQDSGFLSTGFFEFKIKDNVGVTTIPKASLTSYEINGSVGDLVRGSTTYEGDAASFTDAGALTQDDQSTDDFDGFFRPEDIEITTSTNGKEGISSSSLNIQSFSISTSIEREPVTRMGTRTPRFRYPIMPAQGSLNFDVVKNKVTGVDISSLICESGVITIDLKNTDDESVIDFVTSGCCLESVDESTSLDDNTVVSFSYYFPIIT